MLLRIGPRHMLVEAAWATVEHHPYWKTEFARLARRMDEHKAVVAVARRLLVAIWHGPAQRALTERAADKHAEPQRVATKLRRWSWELSDEQRGGLTTRQFTHSAVLSRYLLMRLQLGEDVHPLDATHFRYGNRPRRRSRRWRSETRFSAGWLCQPPRRVASVDELPSVKPELRVTT
jgi:hypothetical protein